MTRYEIRMKKVGAIVKCDGLVDRIVATNNEKGTLVLYVEEANRKAFDKLIANNNLVDSVQTHPIDLNTRIKAYAKANAK